ncbi:MAG: hypothetical protein ACO3QO_03315 [Candidatus Kapaibacteriota bacterium]
MICKATMRVITVLTLSVVTATTMHAQIDTIRVATADDLRDALVTRRTLPTVFLLEAGEYIVTEPIALTNRQELIGQGADRTVMRFRLQQPTSCIRIHGARSASIPVDTLLWDGSRYRVTPALHTVPPTSWVELTDDDRALVTSDWAIGSAGLIGTVDAQGRFADVVRLRCPKDSVDSCRVS